MPRKIKIETGNSLLPISGVARGLAKKNKFLVQKATARSFSECYSFPSCSTPLVVPLYERLRSHPRSRDIMIDEYIHCSLYLTLEVQRSAFLHLRIFVVLLCKCVWRVLQVPSKRTVYKVSGLLSAYSILVGGHLIFKPWKSNWCIACRSGDTRLRGTRSCDWLLRSFCIRYLYLRLWWITWFQ